MQDLIKAIKEVFISYNIPTEVLVVQNKVLLYVKTDKSLCNVIDKLRTYREDMRIDIKHDEEGGRRYVLTTAEKPFKEFIEGKRKKYWGE